MKIFIKKIIELRKARGLTIKKLSEFLDITPRTIYNWESGKSFPSKAELISLSHLLNVRLNEISNYKDFPLFYTKPSLIQRNIPERSVPSEHIQEIINQLKALPDFNYFPVIRIIIEYVRLASDNRRLEAKARKYASIIDRLDCILYTKDIDRKIRYYNRKFLSFIPDSFKEENIPGSSFKDIFPGNDELNKLLSMELSVFSSGFELYRKDFIMPTETSTHKYHLSISPLAEMSGKVIEIAVCFYPIPE